MVGAAHARRVDQLGADLDVAVSAGLIDVVVLHEHRRRQHDVGEQRRLGHELLVYADKKIVAEKAPTHAVAVRCDHGGIRVLDQHGVDRRSATKRFAIPGQHARDPAHIQLTNREIAGIQPLDQRLVPAIDVAVAPERPAAFMAPGARDRRQAAHREQTRRAVAGAGKPVSHADIAALRGAVELGESLDRLHRKPGNPAGPFRSARSQMRLQRVGAVGVSRHVGAVGISVPKRDMHDGAGQRAVRARARREMEVGRLRRPGPVRIDHDELRPTLLASAGDVYHRVHLGPDGIAAPDDDQVGFRHFARVGTGESPDAGDPAGLAGRRADRFLLPGIAHDVAQAIDPVALHKAHRARVVIGPDRLGTVLVGGRDERFRDPVQRLLPAYRPKLTGALRAGTQQRGCEALRVVDALGVAGDLGADDASGVAVRLRPAHRADAPPVQHLDFQGTGGRTVVRTSGAAGLSGLERHRKSFASRRF